MRELQATTYNNLAICHKFEKNYKKMGECSAKSVELKATIKGFYNLGLANKFQYNFDEAIAALKKGVQLNADDPQGL